ncbi:MAG: T9SS type A sorting domain-containing protein [Bacteroidales bacterium]|nr:T9SS type A sorting domain-containing protein [Bacteroidales bacterium]
MKNLSIIIFILIFCQITVSSQPCLPSGITFTNQAQIDSFQTNYPNCTEIEGSVTIKYDGITNLNGLSSLTSIQGSLIFGISGGTNSLTNFIGLDALTFIGSTLEIYTCNSLINLTGLGSLTTIGSNLIIGGHYWGSPAITNLSGLDALTSIGGTLEIHRNDALTSLSALDNVTSIGGGLVVEFNDGLTSLSGLDNLTSIGGGLSIVLNSTLTSLLGLDNVTSIGGALYIMQNPVLASLMGLDNIDAGSITYLDIYGNNLLSTCEVQSICDYLAIPGANFGISYNATGCNNPAEVEAACGVGIPYINFESEFSIYPNPANDILSISCKDGATIEKVIIYNQMGQKVFEGELSNNTVDVSSLHPGMYIIELINQEWKVRRKLIVE